jgi:outer membrane protein TolC
MIERSVPALVLLLALLGRPAAAEELATTIPAPLPLEWCLERAREHNPELAVEHATAEAAMHRIAPAGALEDPRFGYQLVNLPLDDRDLDSTPMSGQQLGLSQTLPFPGLLGNRRRAASAAADAAAQQLEDRRLRIASAVERAWANLGFAQRALVITERNLDLLRQLTRIAEAKYGVGSGLQQDVLRAQVQLTVLLQERLRREADIRAAEASLAALLDLPAGALLPRTTELIDDSPLPDLETLLARLADTSPRLRALAARVEEAERRQRVAELEGYPSFDLDIGYRIRSRAPGDPVAGDDFLSTGVTIRLPLNRTKWRARVAERGALLRRAKAEYRAAGAALQDAIRSRFADLVRADAEVDLVEHGLLPQARQSLESSRSAYQVDRVDFLSLINSQVSLLQAGLQLERSVADRRIAFAAIEAALGEGLR